MRALILACFVFSRLNVCGQEEVIHLYDGKPPGSETWTHSEKEREAPTGDGKLVYDVVNPTLTVLRPPPSKANGVGVVICPGGGFHMLWMGHEGFAVARALNEKGYTCFVLKYRLVRCETDNPRTEFRASITNGTLIPKVVPLLPLVAADGGTAIRHVRNNGEEYGIKDGRVGIIGFSAGGTVAAFAACQYTADARPDFAAPIYFAYGWTKHCRVPPDAPPIFLAAATDDEFGLAKDSIEMWQEWTKAGRSAELHMFAKGGHAFGARKQGLPSDRWIDQFTEWLEKDALKKQ